MSKKNIKDSDNIVKRIFNNKESALKGDMDISIQHNLEDGKYREYLVRDILKKIIPSKYEITNGFIIDSNNNKSDEMDIIIYDKSYVPPFFDESYTLVPIEAVIAVIQVKTTLTKKQLGNAIDNLNSIDKLHAKTGGKIISANGGVVLQEERYIAPYKIIVAQRSNIAKNYDFCKNLANNYLDIIYIVDDCYDLYIKRRKPTGVVNKSKDDLDEDKIKGEINRFNCNKLCNFTLSLLDMMKLINNSIIINYEEYMKGMTGD